MAAKRTRGNSASSFSHRSKHDVFLSFIGEDSGKNFTDQLHTALVQAGIHTIRDDEELRRKSKGMKLKMVKAIEDSRVSIVVFSSNYAFSWWCLDELVNMMDCRRKTGQTVLPVFYDVDPSDVRRQSGSLAVPFARHEECFKEEADKVDNWRRALTEVGNLSGWHLQNVAKEHESKVIQSIVKEVLIIVNQTLSLHVASYPVGIDSRVAQINALLNFSSCDVRIIGICGMSGLGKTTLAKAVYNQIRHRFEGCSFLANVGEISNQPNGLIHLQEQLLSDVLLKYNLKISNVARGINMIKQRVCYKRFLIILDDVDQSDQLNALAINRESFGMGSRIIITSRNEQLLNQVDVDEIYAAQELNQYESLKLFSWHAFRKDRPIDGYLELAKDVVGNVGGVPLALEVLGSFMFDKRSIPDWRDALFKLKRIPHNQILGKLGLSFDALDDTEKDIFLDIACFFNGMDKDYAIMILDGCGLFPDIGISVLSQRSLIKINEYNEIRMHDLLRDMGKQIVSEECPRDPGKCSRLWFCEDVCEVLTKHVGSKSVEGLILNMSKFEDASFDAKAFVDMHRLRLLQLNYVHLRGGYEHLSKELRWLCWHGFPLNSIPTNFDMENLIVLDMENSSVEEVWKEIKLLKRLKILNLSHSPYLIKTPNFLGLPSLERLIFEGCISLVEVHQSVGFLEKLLVMNLKDCHSLMDLPSSICKLGSLEELNLSGCSTQVCSKTWYSFFQFWGSGRKKSDSISLLPASLSGLWSLRSLNLSYCNLYQDLIPIDFRSLISLERLYLSGNSFCTLPDSISNVSHLRVLKLDACLNLEQLPELPSNLVSVDLEDCTSLERLPTNISDLYHLYYLGLDRCKRLLSLPALPPSLGELRASGCSSIEVIDLGYLPSLQDLYMDYDHFCSLSGYVYYIFEQLQTLTLGGCMKSRSLPMIPSCVDVLFLEGPTSLVFTSFSEKIVIQNFGTPQSLQGTHMEGCHHPENTLRKKSLFQGLYRMFEVFGPGNEIPVWISYQRMGCSISFEVSPFSGCEIEGFDVSVVFATEEEANQSIARPFFYGTKFTRPIIHNKTKGIQWFHRDGFKYRPSSPDQDQVWLRHVPVDELHNCLGDKVGDGPRFEVGDQVEVSVEIKAYNNVSIQVKKCGVLVVHKPDEKGSQSDDEAMMQYTSATDDFVISGEESVVFYTGDENTSAHNEDVAGASSDSSVKRLRIEQ